MNPIDDRAAPAVTSDAATDPRLTFLLDVDNTLLDNDAAKADLGSAIEALLGPAGVAHFWTAYEAVRAERGGVNIPLSLARFQRDIGLIGHGVRTSPEPGASRQRRFALADLMMGFPFDRYLFPASLDAIAHLRRLGRVAILSDGDPTFQPSKIWRAGLDAAVDGAVLVFDRKEDHLDEVVAAFPADHYVLVDDKPRILTVVRERLGATLTTIHIRRGHYATEAQTGPPPDLVIDDIAELLEIDAGRFVRPQRASA